MEGGTNPQGGRAGEKTYVNEEAEALVGKTRLTALFSARTLWPFGRPLTLFAPSLVRGSREPLVVARRVFV